MDAKSGLDAAAVLNSLTAAGVPQPGVLELRPDLARGLPYAASAR